MSSNRPSSRPSSSAPASATPSSFDPPSRMSRQRSTNRRCLHRYFIRSIGLSSERRSSPPMTTRRNPPRSYSDHIFSVSSQCRKNASTVRTMLSSATRPSLSDPNVADCRLKLSASQCSLPGTPTVPVACKVTGEIYLPPSRNVRIWSMRSATHSRSCAFSASSRSSGL